VFGRKNNSLAKFVRNVLGYRTHHIYLYEIAITHCSVAVDSKLSKATANNERMEYLGDAVWNCVIAHYLYMKFPCAGEGFLTALRSRLVCREHLNQISCKMGLDEHVRRLNSSLHCRSIYGDAMEAIIGAAFLDKGYEFTKTMIINRILNLYVDIDALAKTDTNYKNTIQMWAQRNRHQIDYKVVDFVATERHAHKQFIVNLLIDNEIISEGCDFSIKSAQQQAAMAACEKLGLINVFIK
jgi:ribonuclease-3